jgi:NADH-quinone oxidoreductase subunit J
VFLFVIMLLNLSGDAPPRRPTVWKVTTVLSASLFALGLLYMLHKGGALVPGPGMTAPLADSYGGIESVGISLFTTYLLPFEITGLLMLTAVIGAVVLARKKIA